MTCPSVTPCARANSLAFFTRSSSSSKVVRMPTLYHQTSVWVMRDANNWILRPDNAARPSRTRILPF
jgi:hypothetical protein